MNQKISFLTSYFVFQFGQGGTLTLKSGTEKTIDFNTDFFHSHTSPKRLCHSVSFAAPEATGGLALASYSPFFNALLQSYWVF